MSLKKLLDEISVIPGVTGTCVFNQDRNALCKSSDTQIDSEILKKIGSHLIRMLDMGKMYGIEVSGSHYRFDNFTLVSTPLGLGSILLTLCEIKANCSLVATTAAMLAADLKTEIGKMISEDISDSLVVEEAVVETDQNLPKIAPYLQDYLNQIEEALAEAIGPVAEMVLHDNVETWLQKGPAEPTRLIELAELLYEEINDEALIEEFKARIEKFL